MVDAARGARSMRLQVPIDSRYGLWPAKHIGKWWFLPEPFVPRRAMKAHVFAVKPRRPI